MGYNLLDSENNISIFGNILMQFNNNFIFFQNQTYITHFTEKPEIDRKNI